MEDLSGETGLDVDDANAEEMEESIELSGSPDTEPQTQECPVV